jgi:hypothetical protein
MTQIDIVEKVLTHEYLMAFYGVIVYYAIVWSLAKNACEKKGVKFNFKKWKQATKDNLIVTILIVPLVIIFDDEIVYLYNEFAEDDIVMGKWIYLMAGPLTDLIFRLVQKLRKSESN